MRSANAYRGFLEALGAARSRRQEQMEVCKLLFRKHLASDIESIMRPRSGRWVAADQIDPSVLAI